MIPPSIRRRGFTLVELVTVMFIIAILATLVVSAVKTLRHGGGSQPSTQSAHDAPADPPER